MYTVIQKESFFKPAQLLGNKKFVCRLAVCDAAVHKMKRNAMSKYSALAAVKPYYNAVIFCLTFFRAEEIV